MSISLPNSTCVYTYIYISIYIYIYMCVCVCIYLSLYLSIYLSLSPRRVLDFVELQYIEIVIWRPWYAPILTSKWVEYGRISVLPVRPPPHTGWVWARQVLMPRLQQLRWPVLPSAGANMALDGHGLAKPFNWRFWSAKVAPIHINSP